MQGERIRYRAFGPAPSLDELPSSCMSGGVKQDRPGQGNERFLGLAWEEVTLAAGRSGSRSSWARVLVEGTRRIAPSTIRSAMVQVAVLLVQHHMRLPRGLRSGPGKARPTVRARCRLLPLAGGPSQLSDDIHWRRCPSFAVPRSCVEKGSLRVTMTPGRRGRDVESDRSPNMSQGSGSDALTRAGEPF